MSEHTGTAPIPSYTQIITKEWTWFLYFHLTYSLNPVAAEALRLVLFGLGCLTIHFSPESLHVFHETCLLKEKQTSAVAKLKERRKLCCPKQYGNSLTQAAKSISMFLAGSMAIEKSWGTLQKAHRNDLWSWKQAYLSNLGRC